MSVNNGEIAGCGACRFGDVIDIPAFARLLESFFQATGIPNGVVDADGTLLCLAAGDNACTRFHRAVPACAERCRDSNLLMMRDLRAGCVAGGLCHNGLMDYATPVIVEGRMLATLFLGQVLHEPPDLGFFRAQAARFGFDEEAYLAAIQAVPVVDKARIDHLMSAMVEMARMMAASGLARLRQTVLEQDLSTHIQRQIQLKDILDSSPVAVGWSDGESRIEYLNRQFTQQLGYSLDDLPDLQTWYLRAYPDLQYRQTVIVP
jgi:ligand-binding sensor protein